MRNRRAHGAWAMGTLAYAIIMDSARPPHNTAIVRGSNGGALLPYRLTPSWAIPHDLGPGNHASAGKRRSGRSARP